MEHLFTKRVTLYFSVPFWQTRYYTGIRCRNFYINSRVVQNYSWLVFEMCSLSSHPKLIKLMCSPIGLCTNRACRKSMLFGSFVNMRCHRSHGLSLVILDLERTLEKSNHLKWNVNTNWSNYYYLLLFFFIWSTRCFLNKKLCLGINIEYSHRSWQLPYSACNFELMSRIASTLSHRFPRTWELQWLSSLMRHHWFYYQKCLVIIPTSNQVVVMHFPTQVGHFPAVVQTVLIQFRM